ncbi:antibiotic biosynthesis monooxygenase [Spirulina sp. CCNP1310]|uniref:antibiotic biosynthesis monooxygenase n=1 Tax=Spirulina sp. CCNP1310 TaxID=3110249 RepID=UPI002B1F8B89|nr:antibiotic biosynthesis monooxygenase [Spirulina sp. CCNP1310]MEA5420693.1 antibiotic biosynthesis monooxygenase [Spirulina sp. CCNP1310]
MVSDASDPSPVTLVIAEIVERDRIPEYEIWSKGINSAARNAPGFLGVDIIRPRDSHYPEYVVIVKFASYDHLRQWMQSDTYQTWVERSRPLIMDRIYQDQPQGLEIWFNLHRHHPYNGPQPAYYKKVIIGVVAVYPLILLAGQVIDPFFRFLPPRLALLISVTFVSALMAYPVMPWLTAWCDRWLYPPSPKP